MIRTICHFSGHVQGVGFRFTAQSIAVRHHVNGQVRNLPDGRVELVMEGPQDQIDVVLDALNQRMANFIRTVTTETTPATGEFKDFSIAH